MTMQETTVMMLSDNYIDRFRAEYYQLKIRYERLVEMIDKYKEGTLEFTLKCPIEVLEHQKNTMEIYLDILADRAEIEEIEL